MLWDWIFNSYKRNDPNLPNFFFFSRFYVGTLVVVHNLVPDLLETNGLLVEKVEGLTVDAGGTVWVVNDNDGVDDNNGETILLSL